MELFSIFETLSEVRKKAAYLAVYERKDIQYFFNKKKFSLTYEEACQLIPEYLKECNKDIEKMEEALAAKKAEHKKLSALCIDNDACYLLLINKVDKSIP
ncbi:MAG: hypothetical protein Q7T50_00025 [Candidatus Magasanikbacteria bacterium]|nr:hypothetical protein [Candidatus Magasanikbacteria bacterium]